MRRRRGISRLHLFFILLLCLLVLSAHSTRGQETLSASTTPYRVSGPKTQSAPVSEGNILLHPASGKLPLSVPSQGQTAWRVSIPSRDTGYPVAPNNNKALPDPRRQARRDELGDKPNHSIDNAPNESLADGLADSRTPYHTLYPGSDLQYYAHPLPKTGGIISRFDELAQSHSRIAHIFQLLDPQPSFGRKRLPREQYNH